MAGQSALFSLGSRCTYYSSEKARPPSGLQCSIDGASKLQGLLSRWSKSVQLRALSGSHLRESLSTVKSPSWPVALLDIKLDNSGHDP